MGAAIIIQCKPLAGSRCQGSPPPAEKTCRACGLVLHYWRQILQGGFGQELRDWSMTPLTQDHLSVREEVWQDDHVYYFSTHQKSGLQTYPDATMTLLAAGNEGSFNASIRVLGVLRRGGGWRLWQEKKGRLTQLLFGIYTADPAASRVGGCGQLFYLDSINPAAE